MKDFLMWLGFLLGLLILLHWFTAGAENIIEGPSEHLIKTTQDI